LHWSSYIAFVTMATALDRVAIAGFGQLSVRPQRALRVKAPEDARVNVRRVRVGFDPDEHVFAAQRRTEIRTIRIQDVKFSHYEPLQRATGRPGNEAPGKKSPPSPRRPVAQSQLSCRLQNRAFDGDSGELDFVRVATERLRLRHGYPARLGGHVFVDRFAGQ